MKAQKGFGSVLQKWVGLGLSELRMLWDTGKVKEADTVLAAQVAVSPALWPPALFLLPSVHTSPESQVSCLHVTALGGRRNANQPADKFAYVLLPHKDKLF